MAAYIIGQINITDAETFKIYSEKVAPTVHQYGGRYLVRGGTVEKLEGNFSGSRIVVIEFESADAVKRWYNSEEYVPLIKIRQQASDGDLLMVDGVQ